ncbi:hypothetical protein [Bradyrhizobium sp. 150]|uniref:hypothetical protein n=1 Tax=Bradyrhizobium sp. 150 TaxID=2782625 RepID=UPI001FF97177|nr:hypothetical protein [Bradyrhizobium sp. 150]MCK1670358.1 hypothetical protein [Bradyrhizobium sp. 150]
MHTKDQLAEALRKAGLESMSALAAEGHYHDYISTLTFPGLTLLDDLAKAAQHVDGARRDVILALRERVKAGDFDATDEESVDWANSEEGRETMSWLKNKSSRS